VGGERILDGIIASHDLIHSLKKGMDIGMMIKLYMSKYFDRLGWNFIQQMLEVFGFNEDLDSLNIEHDKIIFILHSYQWISL
jgi:hypothetical protein